MSLVGTRPILQDELRQYELHHRARIAIKPGMDDKPTLLKNMAWVYIQVFIKSIIQAVKNPSEWEGRISFPKMLVVILGTYYISFFGVHQIDEKRIFFCLIFLLIALLHYINVKNKKYDDAIDNKKILAISIVVIVVSILISILYSHRLLRYSFILIISLAAFIKRKAIIVMLRKS